MSDMSITRTRVQRLMDERVTVDKLHEDLLSHIEAREGDKNANEIETKQLAGYRSRQAEIDTEIDDLKVVLEREAQSAATSKLVRAHLTGSGPGVSTEDGVTRYRSFAAYARDQLLVMKPEIGNLAGRDAVQAAKERIARMQRTPEDTTSSDVDGLIPNDYLNQILDVINTSRPVTQSARRVTLNRGKLSYPKITQRPNVLLQGTEKTEGGTRKMTVTMEDITAMSFIGAGDLSWQAMEWSTPDALDLWFSIQAESYAQQTEGTVCAVLAGAAGTISGTKLTGGTADTFATWLAAALGGAYAVYNGSGAMADTLYLSPDMFYEAAGLTTDSNAPLITAGNLNLSTFGGSIAGLGVVVSSGFGTKTAIVGNRNSLIVAENSGAPVQLRAVEPAIGGLEVGVIGAIAVAPFDDSRFADITT